VTVTLVNLAPSAFVETLLSPGLPTAGGPVSLARYVSGVEPGRAAACFLALNWALTDGHALFGDSPALRALQQLRDTIAARRAPSWRRVFTGQGEVAHLQAVWAFMLEHRDWLERLEHRGARPFEPYFCGGLHGLQEMVNDGLFGYDCLGFVGNYLVQAGLREVYPECEVRGYPRHLRLRPLETVAEIEPLTLLAWTRTGTQHIAVVDRIVERDRRSVHVDLCQSSRGGPQRNGRVRLVATDSTGHIGTTECTEFRLSTLGTPACPVGGWVAALRNQNWVLATSGAASPGSATSGRATSRSVAEATEPTPA
jgi:hypothetical protein